jgi:UPF0716 protein FxsA
MLFTVLLVLFILLPITELGLLLKVNEYLHLPGTLALVVGTGILGAALARWQGVLQFQRIQDELRQGRMPAPQLLDGLLILIAGVVLLTPGLITDTLGFVLLLPPGRAAVKAWLRRVLEAKLRNGVVDVTYGEW